MIITKFLHVLLAGLFSGAQFASYCYTINAIRKNKEDILRFSLYYSLFVDLILLIFIFLIFITGTLLVKDEHLAFFTPWIQSAYLLLTLTFVSCTIIYWIKTYNYKQLSIDTNYSFKGKFVYHFFNIAIFVFIVFIVHDAVTKQTYLFKN